MKKIPSWLFVLVLGVVWWAGATLVKHSWYNEAWSHAMLAGVPFGILALLAAGSTTRAHTLRMRRRPR